MDEVKYLRERNKLLEHELKKLLKNTRKFIEDIKEVQTKGMREIIEDFDKKVEFQEIVVDCGKEEYNYSLNDTFNSDELTMKEPIN